MDTKKCQCILKNGRQCQEIVTINNLCDRHNISGCNDQSETQEITNENRLLVGFNLYKDRSIILPTLCDDGQLDYYIEIVHQFVTHDTSKNKWYIMDTDRYVKHMESGDFRDLPHFCEVESANKTTCPMNEMVVNTDSGHNPLYILFDSMILDNKEKSEFILTVGTILQISKFLKDTYPFHFEDRTLSKMNSTFISEGFVESGNNFQHNSVHVYCLMLWSPDEPLVHSRIGSFDDDGLHGHFIILQTKDVEIQHTVSDAETHFYEFNNEKEALEYLSYLVGSEKYAGSITHKLYHITTDTVILLTETNGVSPPFSSSSSSSTSSSSSSSF